LNLLHLYLASELGLTPLEFRRELWHQQTRVHRLSYGVVYVILRLAVLIQYRRVTDIQADRHTTTAYNFIRKILSRDTQIHRHTTNVLLYTATKVHVG